MRLTLVPRNQRILRRIDVVPGRSTVRALHEGLVCQLPSPQLVIKDMDVPTCGSVHNQLRCNGQGSSATGAVRMYVGLGWSHALSQVMPATI